jgi:hypothetical protein
VDCRSEDMILGMVAGRTTKSRAPRGRLQVVQPCESLVVVLYLMFKYLFQAASGTNIYV